MNTRKRAKSRRKLGRTAFYIFVLPSILLALVPLMDVSADTAMAAALIAWVLSLFGLLLYSMFKLWD